MEVEGKVVSAAHKNQGVDEADEQDKDIMPVAKEADGDDRIPGDFPFVEHGKSICQQAEDYEAKNCCRVPGVVDAAELEAE